MNRMGKGYTIVELMVAISLSSIFIGFIYSVYHFSMRMTRSWDEKVGLEDQAMVCMDRLNRDLIAASEIMVYGTDTLTLLVHNRRIDYNVRNGELFRNSIRIHSDKITIAWFVVDQNTSLRSEDVPLPENAFASAVSSRNDKDRRLIFTVQFTAMGPKKQLTLQSAVCPRNADKMEYKTL